MAASCPTKSKRCREICQRIFCLCLSADVSPMFCQGAPLEFWVRVMSSLGESAIHGESGIVCYERDICARARVKAVVIGYPNH